MSIDELLAALRASWSPETTDEWHPEAPARHQCAVSALVIQDYLGGRLVRNKFGDRDVWFNELDDGTEIFHDPQPGRQVYPQHLPQTREQLMQHRDMPERYRLLRLQVAAFLTEDEP